MHGYRNHHRSAAWRVVLAAGILAAFGVTLITTAASGTSPGTNGEIAYSRPIGGFSFAITVINPDGTGERQLTHPPRHVSDATPDWSPDGSKLAFSRCALRCAVYTINADGTGLRRLGPDCSRRRPPACEDRGDPVWSPDGRTIAFVRAFGAVKSGGALGSHGEIAHSELYVMRADGSHPRPITNITRSKPYSADVARAAWSPDGTRLAFGVDHSALGRPADKQALFIIGADGSGLARLSPWQLRSGEHPDFSPDGRTIVFGAGAGDDPHERGGNLFAVRPDGGGLTQLTHSARDGIVEAGSFSPDQASIAFAALRPGEHFLTSLFVMAPDGTGRREVTQPEATLDPDWGPAAPG